MIPSDGTGLNNRARRAVTAPESRTTPPIAVLRKSRGAEGGELRARGPAGRKDVLVQREGRSRHGTAYHQHDGLWAREW